MTYLRHCPAQSAIASLCGCFFFLLLQIFSVQAYGANRVALVIGNAAYREMPLENPVNDALAMRAALERSGFDVVSAIDADLPSMQGALLDFVAKIDASSTALVFYAGHGVQSKGQNFLLPVNATIQSEQQLKFQALELNDVLDELDASGARIKLVILDACRNNPFERSMRGSGRGLAAVDAARGSLIAYATSPGSTASDGEGDNGLYTQELLQALEEPGLKVEEVFKKVRIAVADKSRGQQIPWESSSLTGDFYFVSPPPSNVAANQQAPTASDREALFWQSVSQSDNQTLIESYLERYPNGHFADLATLKIAAIEKAQRAAKQAADAQANSILAEKQRPLKLKNSDAGDQAVMANTTASAGLVDNAKVHQACSDLSGRWAVEVSNNAACSIRELLFEKEREGRYTVSGATCKVALKGKATVTNSELIIDWKMATCSGTSFHQLSEDCMKSEGEIKVKRSLLCKVKDATETLRKR